MGLDEFLAVTVSTALVVVVDGVLVHEQYFHGTRARDRLLGFSATKSALALLVGQAVQGGIAMAGGSLAAAARDWARIGALQIDGRWRDRQVVSRSWVQASSRPERELLAPGRLPSTITTHAGSRHWWPLDPAGERVMADGMRGQFVYVDRPRRVVVVKTSAWPYGDAWWDRQCRDLCYIALPAIADAAIAG